MKILDKYISKAVLSSIGLVTLLLIGLQIFILSVNQIDSLGKGDYGLWPASVFVMLQLPYEVYLFIPMASLLGCLIGLGMLANQRELLVMRAAGMSMWQITCAVFKAALWVMLLVALMGELWVPKMLRSANDIKMQALHKGQSLRTSRGIWVREHDNFMMLGQVLSNKHAAQVLQFQFTADGQLQIARHIDSLSYERGQWVAYGVQQTHFYPTHSSAQHLAQVRLDLALEPSFLQVTGGEPDEMSMLDLYRYGMLPKHPQQLAAQYQLVFLQRLIQPLTTLVMMLLAIPFVFGPLRSSTMGSKLVVGASVGFGFHIINRFFGTVSQVYQWPVTLAAIGPTVLFAGLGLYLMWRSR